MKSRSFWPATNWCFSTQTPKWHRTSGVSNQIQPNVLTFIVTQPVLANVGHLTNLAMNKVQVPR